MSGWQGYEHRRSSWGAVWNMSAYRVSYMIRIAPPHACRVPIDAAWSASSLGLVTGHLKRCCC
jgi:hypothetical protein